MIEQKHDAKYYAKVTLAGTLANGSAHAFITPLHLIKCRLQVDPNWYPSTFEAFKIIIKNDGFGLNGLYTGIVPVSIAYFTQGACKFGFYEPLKDYYKRIAGDKVDDYRLLGWACAGATAEVIADLCYCPFESVKARMQTSKPGAFTNRFVPGFQKIWAEEGLNGFYKGLSPLMARQVPYTVFYFVFFEQYVKMVYSNILTEKKSSYSNFTQLGTTLCCGLASGMSAAFLTHPADTMVSKLNNVKSDSNNFENMKMIVNDIGFRGLWRGLGVRLVLQGVVASMQFFGFDSIKVAIGLETTGGKSMKDDQD